MEDIKIDNHLAITPLQKNQKPELLLQKWGRIRRADRQLVIAGTKNSIRKHNLRDKKETRKKKGKKRDSVQWNPIERKHQKRVVPIHAKIK